MKKWGILSASVLACALLAAYLTAGSRVDDTARLPSHQTEPTSSSSPETTPWNSTPEFRNTNRYNVVLEMVQGPFQGWFGGLASSSKSTPGPSMTDAMPSSEASSKSYGPVGASPRPPSHFIEYRRKMS